MRWRVELAGRRAYVVGGSQGIGLAAARRFAASGAELVLFARREALLHRAALDLRARHPALRVSLRPLDVCDPRAVRAVMDEVVGTVGPPDLLLNCAGRARPAHFDEIPEGQVEETLRLNFLGTWYTVRALLEPLVARRGIVVNTASLAGLTGVFGYTDYCASKFAVVGFSEALRRELGPRGVRVHVLCPPDTDTPGLAEENRRKPPETAAISARARVLSADAVAEALVRGLGRRRLLIVPGFEGRLAVLAQRLAPGLVDWLSDRTVGALHRGGG